MKFWPFHRSPKRFGYKRDRKDTRDHLFAWARPNALQTASDLTPHVKQVLDQGHTNTCGKQRGCRGITRPTCEK